ncbi:hypothetical protein CRUP_019791 [Coryphaenoides rupestris]|nr:hypothetical protein CRUP_019791 [Coryphaenoides rupestris]
MDGAETGFSLAFVLKWIIPIDVEAVAVVLEEGSGTPFLEAGAPRGSGARSGNASLTLAVHTQHARYKTRTLAGELVVMVKGYRVYYTMDPSRPMNEWQIHNVQDSVITTIQNLVTSETYTIQLCLPGQPGKFKVGKVTDTSIELTWEPAYTKEGIVNYELLYKPVKFGSLEKLTFGPRNSYTVEGLKANTEYSFSLAAISNKGIGAFTNELMHRTSQASVVMGSIVLEAGEQERGQARLDAGQISGRFLAGRIHFPGDGRRRYRRALYKTRTLAGELVVMRRGSSGAELERGDAAAAATAAATATAAAAGGSHSPAVSAIFHRRLYYFPPARSEKPRVNVKQPLSMTSCWQHTGAP